MKNFQFSVPGNFPHPMMGNTSPNSAGISYAPMVGQNMGNQRQGSVLLVSNLNQEVSLFFMGDRNNYIVLGLGYRNASIKRPGRLLNFLNFWGGV